MLLHERGDVPIQTMGTCLCKDGLSSGEPLALTPAARDLQLRTPPSPEARPSTLAHARGYLTLTTTYSTNVLPFQGGTSLCILKKQTGSLHRLLRYLPSNAVGETSRPWPETIDTLTARNNAGHTVPSTVPSTQPRASYLTTLHERQAMHCPEGQWCHVPRAPVIVDGPRTPMYLAQCNLPYKGARQSL